MVRHVAVDVPNALPDFTIAEAVALKALAAGNASEDQQRRAFEFVVYRLAKIGAPSFHPGDPHSTAFKEGRRSVGIHINYLVQTPTEKLKPPTKPRGKDA